jgi:hypothetical protein
LLSFQVRRPSSGGNALVTAEQVEGKARASRLVEFQGFQGFAGLLAAIAPAAPAGKTVMLPAVRSAGGLPIADASTGVVNNRVSAAGVDSLLAAEAAFYASLGRKVGLGDSTEDKSDRLSPDHDFLAQLPSTRVW